MTTEAAAGRAGRFLERLAATVDFRPIEEELQKLYPTKMGRPSHPPLVLFKMLLLEHCYNLSDPEVEAQVSDRLSFRRFVGLSLDGAVPDETALVRFRARLVAGAVEQRLLEHVNAQLQARGLILNRAKAKRAAALTARWLILSSPTRFALTQPHFRRGLNLLSGSPKATSRRRMHVRKVEGCFLCLDRWFGLGTSTTSCRGYFCNMFQALQRLRVGLLATKLVRRLP